ncbi:MAG TPA: methionine--tRNA ligase [Chthonomonadaceae bacterium]|nr:methionine--tRNA ligase [Chthonomonadaceae bacterium]
MTESEKSYYYVTTPIYYVNGQPHVGAGLTTVSCDVLARYQKLRGRKAWFITGTDENATNVQEAAAKEGVPTLEFVDRLAGAFSIAWQQLHVAADDFIRTTEPRHVRAVQEFFLRLKASGYIYLDTYEGWYSVSDETFLRDSEVKDGVSIDTGRPVIRVQEPNYFFRLSAFAQPLLAHIEAHPAFLQPEFRRNEVVSFIQEGLRDMSVTRANRGWGIPVPGEPDKVIYVWFDALINYLAAVGWPDDARWQEFWPADLHFMGKEIFVRFHATLWPAMLLAIGLPLPETVYAHGWWTIQGAKGGKHGARLPHPTRLTQLLSDRSGAPFDLAADAQRYLLCREMNYGPDTEFSVENLLRRFNTDLANDLGNLLNRTISMMGRYFESVVPQTSAHDPEIVALALEIQEEFTRAMAEFRLNIALESAWKLVGRMNKYIDEKAPWNLDKAARQGDSASREALAAVLYACLEATRIVSVLVGPFMPDAAGLIQRQLGLEGISAANRWDDLAWGGLAPGTKVGPAQPVFPRIQDVSVDEATLFALGSAPGEAPLPEASTVKETNPTVSENAPVPGTPVPPPEPQEVVEPQITIEDFMKVQLRAAEILAAEPVPNATKLLRLTVQAGPEDTRTILAGIAEFYQPDELVGRQVVIVANLQPRKMRGIESQGMLLAADVDGRAILLQPDQPVPVGARVR